MNNVDIEYINYDPNIHLNFPLLKTCKVYSKNEIINVYLEGTKIFNDINNDVGYDNKGKYLSITIGQWHNIGTGKSISNEEFYELSELDVYEYDYVSIVVKVYVTEDYRACYHNDYNNKIVISFIPYKMINFTENNADSNPFIYKMM